MKQLAEELRHGVLTEGAMVDLKTAYALIQDLDMHLNKQKDSRGMALLGKIRNSVRSAMKSIS